MKAKILTTVHSGVRVGTIGEIVQELGGGAGIEVDVHRTSLFGGGDVSDKATMYFSNSEFERIEEETVQAGPEDQEIKSSPQISVTVTIGANDISFKLHLPEGEDVTLEPGVYFAVIAKVEEEL